jgi:hypothetical protein
MMTLRGACRSFALIDKALALNPNGNAPGVGNVGLCRCKAFLALGRYDDAIAACQESAAQNDQWLTHVYLVAAYAQSGDASQSATERVTLLKQQPGLTIAGLKAKFGNVGTRTYLQQAETHLYAGLRKAGIPES